MLVILCIEQVREVRGSEQIRYFALLRFIACLFTMTLFLVVKIAKTRLTFYRYFAFESFPIMSYSSGGLRTLDAPRGFARRVCSSRCSWKFPDLEPRSISLKILRKHKGAR